MNTFLFISGLIFFGIGLSLLLRHKQLMQYLGVDQQEDAIMYKIGLIAMGTVLALGGLWFAVGAFFEVE